MRRSILAATAALALIVGVSGVGSLAVAQDGQGQGGGQGGGQGRRGGQGQQMDPEQMRGRMLEALKERLGASDEDWQALEPKVQRVLEAQQNARAGGMMGMAMGGGRGGAGGGGAGGGGGGAARPNPEAEPTPLMAAGRDLRTLLDDENAAADQIREKLDAFRAARKQAATELDTARGELQGLLTQRQEAMLVVVGLLE